MLCQHNRTAAHDRAHNARTRHHLHELLHLDLVRRFVKEVQLGIEAHGPLVEEGDVVGVLRGGGRGGSEQGALPCQSKSVCGGAADPLLGSEFVLTRNAARCAFAAQPARGEGPVNCHSSCAMGRTK